MSATINHTKPRLVAVEEHFRTAELEAVLEGPERLFSKALSEQLEDLGEQRLVTMDDAGIDVQVLSSAAPHLHSMTPAKAVDVAARVNDALVAAIAAHPTRFAGLTTLATPDPESAARELERAVHDLGLCGAMIHGHTQGRYLDDQSFWPIFEAAENLGVPIYLHPTYVPQAVMDAYYSGLPEPFGMVLATGAMGWHYETAMHAMRMIVGGVFRKFPKLQLILGHAGEGLPFYLGRAIKVLRRPSPEMAEHFEHIYRNNFHITTSAFFSEAPFKCALEVTPVEHILFAVDYPYSNAAEGADWIRTTASVDEETRRLIMHGNSDRLFNLYGASKRKAETRASAPKVSARDPSKSTSRNKR